MDRRTALKIIGVSVAGLFLPVLPEPKYATGGFVPPNNTYMILNNSENVIPLELHRLMEASVRRQESNMAKLLWDDGFTYKEGG